MEATPSGERKAPSLGPPPSSIPAPTGVSGPQHPNLGLVADLIEVQSPTAMIPPLHAIEALVGQGQWTKVAEQLSPHEASLSPRHALLLAIALGEAGGADGRDKGADRLAIRAFAGLLDVPEASPLALLLARRTLRRSWRQAPAPKARVQLALVVTAVVLGALVGLALDEWRDRSHSRRVPVSAVAPDGTIPSE